MGEEGVILSISGVRYPRVWCLGVFRGFIAICLLLGSYSHIVVLQDTGRALMKSGKAVEADTVPAIRIDFRRVHYVASRWSTRLSYNY